VTSQKKGILVTLCILIKQPWFMFSGDRSTNVDFSDFILVKYIVNLTSENKQLSLKHKKIKAI
jgi:hypothetical protein